LARELRVNPIKRISMQFIGPSVKIIVVLLFGGCLGLLILDYLRAALGKIDFQPLPRLVELTVQIGVALLLAAVYIQMGGVGGINYRPGGTAEAGYDVFFYINSFNLPLLVLCLCSLVCSRLAAERGQGGELPHLLLVVGILGSGLAGDLLNIYIYYELFILTSIYVSHQRDGGRAFGMARLQLVGSLLVLFAFFIVFHYAGSFHLSRILNVASLPTAEQPLSAALLLLALALALKGGVIPFGLRRLPERSGVIEGELLRPVVSLFILCRLAFPFSRLGCRLGWIFVIWGILAVVISLVRAWRVKGLYARLVYSSGGLLGFGLIALGMGLEYSLLDCYAAVIRFVSLAFIVGCGLVVLWPCRDTKDIRKMSLLDGFGYFFLSCSLVGLPPLESFWGKSSLIRGAYQLPAGVISFILMVLSSLMLATLLLPAAYRQLALVSRGGEAAATRRTISVRAAQLIFLGLLAGLSLDTWWGLGFVGPAAEYIIDYLSY
jgi:formate hydrogenlyase subunit 3/multisubunit Na+/H+ antiporter MnhD subunit